MNLPEMEMNPPVAPGVLQKVEPLLGKLPADYRAFLEHADGGEGFVGANYLILWHAEELDPFNRDYEVHKYAPGLLLFGSSGGGEGYAFDTRQGHQWPVVRVPFIGMSLRYAEQVGGCFDDFLRRLAAE